VERYGREILFFIGSRCRVETTRANGAAGHLWEQSILPERLTSNSLLWSPANTGPLLVRNQAVTIHDLSPLEHPEWFRKSFAAWYRLFLPLLAKQARLIFTPSEYIRQKVMKRFGVDHVIVASNGVNTSLFHPGKQQCMYQLPKQFILFVGTLQPRKNLQTLLNAWDEIKNEYKDLWLIIAGGEEFVFEKIKFIASERVQCLGYVPEEALPGIYSKAMLLVLPSHDEGFGLPVLEAMACGTPVIVSDGGALPEIVGDAGLIFCCSDGRSLSKAIRECIENSNLYSSLVEKGLERVSKFSWQTSAELIWNRLNEL
jgi:glycosyltransferase involved in cell wall biosynthesis